MFKIYVGTYFTPQSAGIYTIELDEKTGMLGEPSLFLSAPDSKYIYLGKSTIVSGVARKNGAGLLIADRAGNISAEVLTESTAPCYVDCYGEYIFSANFHEGTVQIYNKKPELLKRISIAYEAGCHQTLANQGRLFVPCLNLDCIKLFDISNEFEPCSEILFPKCSGPRHVIFVENKLYVAAELSNQLFCFIDHGDSFEQTHCLDIPGSDSASSTAAIRLHPNRRRLYISTRGANLISVFDITNDSPTLIQQTDTGGDHPRDFVLTPDGKFLLVANRDSGDICSFALDNEGNIGEIICRMPLHMATAIVCE